ncbi:uncharacterized protein [Mytilus edulis]|uniref:uncharacterized protein isoform X5 n=1 Tax=Mytilus edulis TaxID=6550 RepID=UPI0039EFB0FD
MESSDEDSYNDDDFHEYSDPEDNDDEIPDYDENLNENADSEENDNQNSDYEENENQYSDPEENDVEISDYDENLNENADSEENDNQYSEPEENDVEYSEPEENDVEYSEPEESDVEYSEPEEPEENDVEIPDYDENLNENTDSEDNSNRDTDSEENSNRDTDYEDKWNNFQNTDGESDWHENTDYEDNWNDNTDYEDNWNDDVPYRVETDSQTDMSKAAQEFREKLLQQTAEDLRVEDDNVPTEIRLMSDKKSLPLYLKLLESGSEKKRDIRLVIVGEKGAGKTSFLKRLFEEEIGEVTSTNGIEIHRIKCLAESDDGIWNKLEGINEEAELHKRLLQPYDESLKSQVNVNSKASVEGTGYKIDSIDKPTSSSAKSVNSASQSLNILQPKNASVSHEHPFEQAEKEIKSMLQSEVDLRDKEDYATLLLWDFAGDTEFYQTHQTFLSPDAIYIVVTKLNKSNDIEAQEMFGLWMDSIHCYCTQEKRNSSNHSTNQPLCPPVILVGTWKDEVKISEGEEIQNACMKRLDTYARNVSADACRHIRDEYTQFISNTKDNNDVFHEIRKSILKLARTIKTWNKDYPLKFIQLEKRLQEKKKELPIISIQEIKHLSVDSSKPLSEAELTLFLKYHHEIRSLVYFEDLPNHIILDTQWLSDAFKCIVTAEKFQLKIKTFKNKEKWDDLNQRGVLHSEVLGDIFKNEQSILSKHKDHILKVMEKFDIIIRPITSEEDATTEISCYYVPCMVKEKPECDIYKMFKVTEDTCKKSTWLCLKFNFLPPHLINHLIASLCREYEVAKVAKTKQKKNEIALFRGTAIFDLQKTRLQKLLITKSPNLIQIQILEFMMSTIIKRGSYSHITDFVETEITNIISKRYKMTNVTFERKWECGLVNLDSVKGSNVFIEEHNTEYFCEACTATHKLNNEWSKQHGHRKGIKRRKKDERRSSNKKQSRSFEKSNSETTGNKETVFTEVRCRVQGNISTNLKVSDVVTRTGSSKVFSKEEFNFAKMGMIVLNILADVLYDLLKQDKQNVKPRSECDITYLSKELWSLNKHIPSNSGGRKYPWAKTLHDIKNTDTATGDDIERIRLTRNELQHSTTYALEDKRYNDLCHIIEDLLKRFDKRNNPMKLYSKRLNDVLARTIANEEVNEIHHQIENEIKTQSELELVVEVKHTRNK